MKTVNEPWYKFFLRAYWQRATNDPDLIFLAPCMMKDGIDSVLGVSITSVHHHAPDGWVRFAAVCCGSWAKSEADD